MKQLQDDFNLVQWKRPIIYGLITTGIFWRFLKLKDNTIHIDLRDYSIEDNPGRIIGILSAMVKQEA